MYQKCINPTDTGPFQRVRPVTTRPSITPARSTHLALFDIRGNSPIRPSFRFGSRRPGVRISPSRPRTLVLCPLRGQPVWSR